MRPTPPRHSQDPCWVFGYGSLIWRAGFPYRETRFGCIRGFKRRFWQGSTDHRGTPGAPGRVVTLVQAPDATCWGRAYRLDPLHTADILRQLDAREVGGYRRHRLQLRLGEGAWVEALTWIAWPDNPNFLGPAQARDIAAQAVAAAGPSGSNMDYVLRLAAALRHPPMADRHVIQVAQWVRRLAFDRHAPGRQRR